MHQKWQAISEFSYSFGHHCKLFIVQLFIVQTTSHKQACRHCLRALCVFSYWLDVGVLWKAYVEEWRSWRYFRSWLLSAIDAVSVVVAECGSRQSQAHHYYESRNWHTNVRPSWVDLADQQHNKGHGLSDESRHASASGELDSSRLYCLVTAV